MTLYVAIQCPICVMVVDYMKQKNIKDINIIDTELDSQINQELRKKYGKPKYLCLL